MVDAVILAGSRNNGPLRICSTVKNEAMIKIDGRYMVEYVIDSLNSCRLVRNIVVVGPEKELKKIYARNEKISFAPPGETAVDSLRNGLSVLNEITRRVLIVTSDIPLITPEALEHFITQGCSRGVDVYYPVVSKPVVEKNYPGAVRTYVKLKDGIFTGGNILLINPEIVDTCAEKAQQIVNLRKKPLKLCKLLGLPFVVKYLLHRLSINEIENKVSDLMNIRGAGVISPYPEVGVDVDKPSDLKLVRNVIINKTKSKSQ